MSRIWTHYMDMFCFFRQKLLNTSKPDDPSNKMCMSWIVSNDMHEKRTDKASELTKNALMVNIITLKRNY